MTALRRGASGLCAVALFALAMWFTNVKPHIDGKQQNPLITKGHIGAVVANRVFSVKVGRVDVASALVQHDSLKGDRRLSTPGIFVIAYLDAMSNRKPLDLGHVRLATRGGLSYSETGRTDISSDSGSFEPMLWRPAFFVFEIPKDRLAGTRLIVGQSDLVNNLSAETEVDLGLDDRRAAQLLVHPPADYALTSS
jgi:hypothetical protein